MISTERLKLRPWRESDILPFRMMCADPKVMEHLGGPQTAKAADEAIAKATADQQKHGHCFWAAERKADFSFIGFCGLKLCDIAGSPVEGEIEIGWRLRRDAWGQGFAKEAAYACFDWGFRNIECARIIAITVSANTRSWGLMDRLRMKRQPQLDFIETSWATGGVPAKAIVYARPRGWA